MLMGSELYFYRRKEDDTHRFMHCLVGTFIKEVTEESKSKSKPSMYGVKLMLSQSRARVLYFSGKEEQQSWI